MIDKMYFFQSYVELPLYLFTVNPSGISLNQIFNMFLVFISTMECTNGEYSTDEDPRNRSSDCVEK